MSTAIIKELFSLLEKSGVEYIICSPGSRNSAVILEADRCSRLKKTIVIDERTAAFVALGISLQSRKPVALLCTSGSALLNYAPASAEAFYQGIPLIFISADRPEEWIDQDDSQTIRQPGALANITKYTVDINCENNDSDYLWYSNRMINQALMVALERKKGPVHINLHLSLNHKETPSLITDARKINILSPPPRLEKEKVRNLVEGIADKKIMVIAGFMQPDNKLQKAVSLFNTLPNVAILAETVSNIHLPISCYEIDTVLFKLDEKEARGLKPDLVISIGGALVSRKLKEFLRNHPPKEHWALSYSDNIIDCFQSLTLKIECEAASLIKSFYKQLSNHNQKGSPNPSYKEIWNRARVVCRRDISKLPWSDLKALKIVLESLPSTANLFLSNGTSVRYGQIIPYPLSHATFSNRGVSGIEGCTSTAIGTSLCYDNITCLITGDMSFGYDIGALSAQLAGANMRIVILDNNGGDIFRFIPATKDLTIREEYLCAPRRFPVALLADAFGWSYFHAESENELEEVLQEFFLPSLAPCILHIDTKMAQNSEILKNYLYN